MADTVRKTPNKIIFSDESEQASAGIISQPPTGMHQVTKAYIDEETGELVVEYVEAPAP